jgi:hypothetical protein
VSRFADAGATRHVDFGACLCPGTPHESDFATVRGELSTPDIANFAGVTTPGEIAAALAAFVVEWNLLGPDGQPWPPSEEAILALKPPTLNDLVTVVNEVVEESSTLPNGHAARSPNTSRASGSPTRATRRKR